MSWRDRLPFPLPRAAEALPQAAGIGALVGLALALWRLFPGDATLRAHPALTVVCLVALGAVIGGLLPPLFAWARPAARAPEPGPQAFEVPFLGRLVFDLDARQRGAAWRLFLELSAHVAPADSPRAVAGGRAADRGDVGAALRSLHAFAGTARERLAEAPPAAVPPGRGTPEDLALVVLHRHLAPFLARWRPRREAWVESGRDAAAWPLEAACRHELERIVRPALQDRAWELGLLCGLPPGRLSQLLPRRPDLRERDLELPAIHEPHPALAASIADWDERLAASSSRAALAGGWRILVAGRAALGRLRKAKTPARGRYAIEQAVGLADAVRAELAAMPPAVAREGSLQGAALALLEEPLARFLARWGGERPRAGEPTGGLSDGACKQLTGELEVLRRALEGQLETLREHVQPTVRA